MQITRTSATTTAPSEWFTGTVYFDSVATPIGDSRLSATNVHFTPGARTNWHSHPFGQTLFILEGECFCQSRGAAAQIMRPGERVFFEPGEEHWHGATPNRFVTHLALQQADADGNAAMWGDPVSDEEYADAAQTAT
jgi:quercetin dioxygenase-like cupin family protein